MNNFAAVVGVPLKKRGPSSQDPSLAYGSDGIVTLLFMSTLRKLEKIKELELNLKHKPVRAPEWFLRALSASDVH